jgi:DNA phosphorothioation-associated putative methyltransferase
LTALAFATDVRRHDHAPPVGQSFVPVLSRFRHRPAPALLRSVKLSLRTREIDCFDYAAGTNPPILHRKETFLASDHPLHAKFARLTQQEEKHGLLDDSSAIGTREGWSSRLAERGFALKGHRLVRW